MSNRFKKADEPSIKIPYLYEPRKYQIPFLQALDEGTKRLVLVWHRRAGKDLTCLSALIAQMIDRVGGYYYFWPEFAEGRRALWQGATKDGIRFMDRFPEDIVKRKNDTEMTVELKNGSIFQIVGTDKFDKKVMGTNPVGCVFSEYSLQNPEAWDYVRPILRENDGFAIFNFTPRGENHAYRLLRMAQENDLRNKNIPEKERWFWQVLTIEDTGVVSKEDIEAERREGMDEALIQQEYYCSFTAPVSGAYYQKQLVQMEKDGRITNVPYEPTLSVDTFWDIGVGDSTAIWFVQRVSSRELRVIDYLEASGEGLNYYIGEVRNRNYVYGSHFAPHDIEVREFTTGITRRELAKNLGVNFRVVKNIPVDDGINLVRNILPKCWFDKDKCRKGLDALRSYHKEWSDKTKEFRSYPAHDWASHSADAFRYFCVEESKKEKVERQQVYTPPFYDRSLKIWKGQ